MLMTALVLWLGLIAPWHQAHEGSWLLLSVHGCSWVFNGNQEHSWLLLVAYVYLWVLMSSHDCSLVALMRSHELGAMNQWALMRAQEHGAMRLWTLISTLEYSWYHRTILMSAPGYSWAHMSACGSSWMLMTGHDCWSASSNNTQKMLSFKMTSM